VIVKTASNARTLRLNWIISVTPREGFSLPDRHRDRQEITELQHQVVGQTLRDVLQTSFLGGAGNRKRSDRQMLQDFRSLFIESGAIDSGITLQTAILKEEMLITLSTVIDTTNEAFIRMMPSSKNLSRRIKDWIGRGGASTTPITTAPVTLVLSDSVIRRQSSNFGNMVADIVRGSFLSPDGVARIGLINSGSFRLDRDIQEGEAISMKTLADIFFHPNPIAVFEMSGKEIIAILKASLFLRNKRKKEGHGDFLQISGLEVVINDKSEIDVFVTGPFGQQQHIETSEVYTVATTDYVSSNAYRDYFGKTAVRETSQDIKLSVEHELRRVADAFLPFLVDEGDRWSWREDDR
jgi:5''-nucleotidase/2'',3''-cyclic phosphodiesterase and related esterases